ncbi:MAG: septum formation initiator family protein [Pseudomonadota bacterium]
MSSTVFQRREYDNGTLVLIAALLLVLAGLLSQLLLAPDGLQKTNALRLAVADTRSDIETLRQRNQELASEVHNLKHGLTAAEERARTDLGMIGEDESFYQIVGSE